jgi:hypothetical protein
MMEDTPKRVLDLESPIAANVVGTKANMLDRIVDLLIIYARSYHWDTQLEPSTRLKLAQQDIDEHFNQFIANQCSLEIKEKADADLKRQQERGAL